MATLSGDEWSPGGLGELGEMLGVIWWMLVAAVVVCQTFLCFMHPARKSNHLSTENVIFSSALFINQAEVVEWVVSMSPLFFVPVSTGWRFRGIFANFVCGYCGRRCRDVLCVFVGDFFFRFIQFFSVLNFLVNMGHYGSQNCKPLLFLQIAGNSFQTFPEFSSQWSSQMYVDFFKNKIEN